MTAAFTALGQERYDAISKILSDLAEKDDAGNFSPRAMYNLASALQACANVANMHAAPVSDEDEIEQARRQV